MKKKKIYALTIISMMVLGFLDLPVSADTSKPDLIISRIDAPDEAQEGDTVVVTVKIKNIGEQNIPSGVTIEVALYIDNENTPVSINATSDGLSAGGSRSLNLNWTAEFDGNPLHVLSVYVDYHNIISEEREDNNVGYRLIEIHERDTDLRIIDLHAPADIDRGETVDIYVSIKNFGKNTTDSISAQLNIPEEGYQRVDTVNGLQKGEIHNFSFRWKADHFGEHTIQIKIFLIDEMEDEKEETIFVNPTKLSWWNASWHYRIFVGVMGNGNFSTELNFTQLLDDLNVSSKRFENNTIRIVKYDTNGNVSSDGEVKDYIFEEKDDFDNQTNAVGNLTWNVTGASETKYYCIYFDVEENIGERTSLDEKNMSISGNLTLTNQNPAEGWWTELIQPIENSYYTLNNATINILVNTAAMAKNVTAEFYYEGNKTEEIELTNMEDNIVWNGTYKLTGSEGNWTIKILSEDNAGYKSPMVEQNIYVGKPDLTVVNISFSTNWLTSPEIFEGDIVTISADIRSQYISMENVTISLYIKNVEDNSLIYNSSLSNLTIKREQANIVNFSWIADMIGIYNITVEVDPNNVFQELNENNNNLSKEKSVGGLPDLCVENIVVPKDFIEEGEKVEITVVITNTGHTDAANAQIKLYIAPYESGEMIFDDQQEVANTYSGEIKIGQIREIRLSWKHAVPGTWLVGVKALLTNNMRDLNLLDNQNVSITNLTVRSAEQDKPYISNISITPKTQEQGRPVKITCSVIDESGIERVDIRIINPRNKTLNSTMNREGEESYSFIFEETKVVGKYNFTITAVDMSYKRNKATYIDAFMIKNDTTPPDIEYFAANPMVQIKNGYINISCTATDLIEIKSVQVNISYPDTYSENIEMKKSVSTGRYYYNQTYELLGKHTFYIMVEDKSGNINRTENKTFWITMDLNDTDNDGMPDWWEKHYGFDPFNPADAEEDLDNDGYTNAKEYRIGTNPTKNIFLQNALYRIKQRAVELVISATASIVITLLSAYGIITRRKRK